MNLLLVIVTSTCCAGNRLPNSPSPTESVTQNIQQLLSEALRSVDKDDADVVADPMTEVEVYAVPFLKHYQIYRVEHFGPYKPELFYVGFAPGKKAYPLTGAPGNYISLGQADGVVIDSAGEAVSYAMTYLEVTRSMSELFYLVQSVEEVDFQPDLTNDEAEVKTAFIEKYRSAITPPTAERANGGYTVIVYAVREQALERHTVAVSREGNIKDDAVTLEQDLPLVYGL